MNAVQSGPLKIFVTVGAQMPFDRLVKAVDDWAELHADVEVFAQIGKTPFRPRKLNFVEFIEPDAFHARILWADLVVSHAGMGSILTALQCGKPILVMPRLGRLHETRNDHQLATAFRFKTLANVAIAEDETALQAMLNRAGTIGAGGLIEKDASDELLATIKSFLEDEATH